MVKITNGSSVFDVTRGAFEEIYKSQGFVEVKEAKKEKTKKPEDDDKSDEENDESFAKSLEEKPISSWTKKEVKKYCAIKNIDIAGTKNVEEAKSIIKETLA